MMPLADALAFLRLARAVQRFLLELWDAIRERREQDVSAVLDKLREQAAGQKRLEASRLAGAQRGR